MAEELVTLHMLLQRLGLCDPEDPHSGRVAERLLRYWSYWTGEEKLRPMTAFPNDPPVDEMIFTGAIPFWSCCSHHLLPYHGNAYIGYIPDKFILGLSKFTLLVRHNAKRPTVQETLTHQIARHIVSVLEPKGLAVMLSAMHTCQMQDTGPGAPQFVTTVLRGALKTHAAKAEFLAKVNHVHVSR